MKTCSKCQLELQLEQFSKDKRAKDGHQGKCKECVKIYYKENKEKIIERVKKYGEERKEDKREYEKKYRKENKEKISERHKNYREDHKDFIKKYRQENKDKIREQRMKYLQENKDKIREQRMKWCQENKDKIKKYHQENKDERNAYVRNRRKADEKFRILCRLRTRLWCALKGANKSATTMELLGVPSTEFLVDYLEKTKVEGKDYSDGEVDHIRPCASFDLTDPEQQRECFHYTNLQWLTKEENSKKGAKLDHETISTDTFLKPLESSEANLCLPSMIE